MLSFIYKLQRKPERVRQKIAIVASAVITGIIIVIWLTTLRSSIGEPALSTKTKDEDIGPFQALTKQLSAFFFDATEAVQTTIGAFSGASEEVVEPQKEEVEIPSI